MIKFLNLFGVCIQWTIDNKSDKIIKIWVIICHCPFFVGVLLELDAALVLLPRRLGLGWPRTAALLRLNRSASSSTSMRLHRFRSAQQQNREWTNRDGSNRLEIFWGFSQICNFPLRPRPNPDKRIPRKTWFHSLGYFWYLTNILDIGLDPEMIKKFLKENWKILEIFSQNILCYVLCFSGGPDFLASLPLEEIYGLVLSFLNKITKYQGTKT